MVSTRDQVPESSTNTHKCNTDSPAQVRSADDDGQALKSKVDGNKDGDEEVETVVKVPPACRVGSYFPRESSKDAERREEVAQTVRT